MDRQTIAIFNDSLERCKNNPKFMDIFYERFLASSQEVRDKFANTDFIKQKAVLEGSLPLMLFVSVDSKRGFNPLKRIAEMHNRNELDVRPELYEYWLDALIYSVQQCDPEYSKSTESAWRQIMRKGIDYMSAAY